MTISPPLLSEKKVLYVNNRHGQMGGHTQIIKKKREKKGFLFSLFFFRLLDKNEPVTSVLLLCID